MDTESVAAKYEVSRAWVHRLVQRRRESGSIAPRKHTKCRRRVLAEQETRLAALITARPPDTTLAELRDALPTSATVSTLWRPIDRLGLTVKQTVHADEQRRPDVVAARQQWRAGLPVRNARQCVFLDECGVTTDLVATVRTELARHTPVAVQELAAGGGGLFSSRWHHFRDDLPIGGLIRHHSNRSRSDEYREADEQCQLTTALPPPTTS
jgi:transposase